MSSVGTLIQSDDFSTKNDYFDEINVQLADNDHIQSRCGEIFVSHRKVLVFVCTECKETFFGYEDFFTHLSEQHLSSEEQLSYEQYEDEFITDEPSVEQFIEMVDDTQEDEDGKEILESIPDDMQEEDKELHQELIQTFESLEEFNDALEEPEGNKTVTFFTDFSKFLEKNNGNVSGDDNEDKTIVKEEEPSCIDSNMAPTDKVLVRSGNYIKAECQQCHKTCQSYAKLRTHMRCHSKDRNFKCTICGFAFTEEFNLRSHIRRHKGEKPHACEHCGKRFTTRTEVNAHTRSHTGERPYVCEICGQGYATSGSLSEHKKRHTNFRPHKCKLCNKAFFDTGLLKEHMVIHTGERKHICDQCEASFPRRKALLQHMKLHSGVKEYKCSICNKAFAQKPGLAAHLKTHRKISKAKDLKCEEEDIQIMHDDPDSVFV